MSGPTLPLRRAIPRLALALLVPLAAVLVDGVPALARVGSGPPRPFSPTQMPGTQTARAQFVPGEVIVRLKRAASARARRTVVGVARARSVRRLHVPGVRVLRLERGESVRAAVRRLSAAPGVEWVEPNRIARLHMVPNDKFFSEQWGLHNFAQVVGGFQAGVSDVDSDLPEAWRLTTGSSDVLVAVVDSGIAPSHPDLAPIIAPGGWDFLDDDKDPSDPALALQHGSLVASIIGARGNDNYGVTGAAQRAAILPLRVAGTDGTLTSADAAEAYAYAASHGARIVNASFGGFGISQVELDAIRAAPEALFIASAGNDSVDTDANPVAPCVLDAPNVLCVAASDQDDSLADFSNFGAQTVDVSAPGVRLLGAQQPFATFFSDGFEANLNQWQADAPWGRTSTVHRRGSFSLADSPAGDYADDTDSAIRTASAINLSGQSRCRLDYFMRFVAEGGPGDFIDGVIVEAANSSAGPWTELNRYSGSTQGEFFGLTEDLTSFAGDSSVFIRFRFVSDSSITFEGAYIDDVSVQCATSTPTGRDFTYGNGTSFSAPLVSGIAVLALALEPSLTTAELKRVLLEGVDEVPALAGATVTGGRSNAAKVLSRIPPRVSTDPPTEVTDSSATLRGTARLHGQEGTVRFEFGLGDGTYPMRGPDVPARNPVAPQPVEVKLDDFRPGVTFHYRFVATTAAGTAIGGDQTVTTGPGPRVSEVKVVRRGPGWGLGFQLTEAARFDGVLDNGKRLRAVRRGLAAGAATVPLGRLGRGSYTLDFALTNTAGTVTGVGQVTFAITRRRSSSASQAAITSGSPRSAPGLVTSAAAHGSGDPNATVPDTPAPVEDLPGELEIGCEGNLYCSTLALGIEFTQAYKNLFTTGDYLSPKPEGPPDGIGGFYAYDSEGGIWLVTDSSFGAEYWLVGNERCGRPGLPLCGPDGRPSPQGRAGLREAAPSARTRDSVRLTGVRQVPETRIKLRLADGTFALAVAAKRLRGESRQAANALVKAEVAAIKAGIRLQDARGVAPRARASRGLGSALSSLASRRTAAASALRSSRRRLPTVRVRRFQGRVKREGLPRSLTNQLRRAGANEATLDQLRSAISGSPPSALGGKRFPDLLASRRAVRDMRAAARRMYLLGLLDA
jgi:subtilisin family serine protease